MNQERIEKFIESRIDEKNKYVKIEFPKRAPIHGLFVTGDDYNHLKSKNLWRIVTSRNFDAFDKTHDQNLTKIFNGAEFSKLSLLEEA
jgi:hypothetical protein